MIDYVDDLKELELNYMKILMNMLINSYYQCILIYLNIILSNLLNNL